MSFVDELARFADRVKTHGVLEAARLEQLEKCCECGVNPIADNNTVLCSEEECHIAHRVRD